MKRILVIFLAAALLQSWTLYAQIDRNDLLKKQGNEKPISPPVGAASEKPARPAPVAAAVSQPVRIDISKPAFRNNSGPSRPSQPAPQVSHQAPQAPQPAPQAPKTAQQAVYQHKIGVAGTFNSAAIRQKPNIHWNSRPDMAVNTTQFVSVAPTSNVVHHHHPFTAGYVRKKLQKLGVTSLAHYITDRQQMMVADKDHSAIRFPQKGPNKTPLMAAVIPSKNFNDPSVLNHMNLVHGDEMTSQVAQMNQSETRAGHYYWHNGNGFNYCHYVDGWGYQWYGWYLGDNYFWTRYYQDRWWFYDSDNDRWCFWDNGYWWWQDPYHVADLYFYSDGQYIPCDSAKDTMVTATQAANVSIYSSPDGTRMVKVLTDTGDAFLFDAAIPPTFNPIYLASQVTGVKFSDVSQGQPLEIMVTLGDGSFDLYDSQGNPLNFGDADAQPAGAN